MRTVTRSKRPKHQHQSKKSNKKMLIFQQQFIQDLKVIFSKKKFAFLLDIIELMCYYYIMYYWAFYIMRRICT